MLPTGSLIETVHESTFLADSPEALHAALHQAILAGSEDNAAIHAAVDGLAEHIVRRNRQMQKVAASLQRFHDPQQGQWVMAVNEVLRNAFRSAESDRREHLRDVLPLLQPVVDHPLSGRDYALRFLMGWLQWKAVESPADAVHSFAEAARLSNVAGADDPFPVYSLRHLAYMHYLQGEFALAHSSIQRALQRTAGNTSDLELAYEAARYAARAGDTETARTLLTRSFDLSPIAALWAMNQEDFQIAKIPVAALLTTASSATGAAIDAALDAWQASATQVQSIAETLGNPILLPETLGINALADARRRANALESSHDLLATAALHKEVENAAMDTFRAAKTQVEQMLADATARKARVALRISKLETELSRWKGTVRALHNEARQAGFSLTAKPGFRLPLIPANERRKRIEAAQLNYATSMENEAEAQRLYDAERPALRTESKKLTRGINGLKAAITELQIALGEEPAPTADAAEKTPAAS